MIYAAAKPIASYEIQTEFGVMGLFNTYKHDTPELLAAMLLFTVAGYGYELEGFPEDRLLVSFTPSIFAAFEESLDCRVNGITLRAHLQLLNPLEMYQLLGNATDEELADMPLVDTLFSGNRQTMMLIVGARTAAWAERYRGAVSKTSNVVKVAFGGQFPVPDELHKLNSHVKGLLLNG